MLIHTQTLLYEWLATKRYIRWPLKKSSSAQLDQLQRPIIASTPSSNKPTTTTFCPSSKPFHSKRIRERRRSHIVISVCCVLSCRLSIRLIPAKWLCVRLLLVGHPSSVVDHSADASSCPTSSVHLVCFGQVNSFIEYECDLLHFDCVCLSVCVSVNHVVMIEKKT